MASKRRPRGKRINPTYFVFCEGETEEEYVKYLRTVFRIPIEINSKRTGDRISQRFMNSYLKTKTRHPKDRVFLMFDLDIPGTLEKLRSLDGILLCSNPCLELWFLLHHREQRSFLSSDNCISTLRSIWSNYRKGQLTEHQKAELLQYMDSAISRSDQLDLYDNPSTSLAVLINSLRDAKQEKQNS